MSDQDENADDGCGADVRADGARRGALAGAAIEGLTVARDNIQNLIAKVGAGRNRDSAQLIRL